MKRTKIIILISVVLFISISVISVILAVNKKEKNTVLMEKNTNMKVIPVDLKNPGLDDDEKNTINIYQNLSTAVVNITVYKTEYINYFFDMYPQKSEGEGSGAFIDPEGYIITNYHVVGDADKVTVALSSNDKIYDAIIVGTDPENDLAVIKIRNPPKNLTIIPIGTSENLKVGQKVYAIGNPFGLDRTLTSGIISGLGRPIKSENDSVIEGAIQTDASINPGNSGGPLIDSSGKMIGINTMIISPSGGSVGLGFAIPIDKAKEIIPQLIKIGYVKRGWIDATFLPLTPQISKSLNYSVDYGLMIMDTAKNGEADKAGLKGGTEKAVYRNTVVYLGGDIIIAVNGTKISDYSALVQLLKNKKPGENVSIDYIRNNKKYTAQVKLIDKRQFTQNQ
jgi:S1-C subfamily serine protease